MKTNKLTLLFMSVVLILLILIPSSAIAGIIVYNPSGYSIVDWPYNENSGVGRNWHEVTGSSAHKNDDAFAQDWNWGSGSEDCGKSLLSATGGEVVYTHEADDTGTGYGRQVVVQAGNTYAMRYAHLQSVTVPEGKYIWPGYLIGTIGQSGNQDSCHLHMVLYKDIFDNSPTQNATHQTAYDWLREGKFPSGSLSTIGGAFAAGFSMADTTRPRYGNSDPSVRWHPDGTLIKIAGGPVYLIHDGKKKHVVSADYLNSYFYGFDWNHVITVDPNELNSYTDGEEINQSPRLVKASGDDVYLIFNNRYKRKFLYETFKGLQGYDAWNSIQTISDAELSSYPLDPTVPVLSSPYPDGVLIKKKGDSRVYVITQGKKRQIETDVVFNMLGYDWTSIVEGDTVLKADGTRVDLVDYVPEISSHIDQALITNAPIPKLRFIYLIPQDKTFKQQYKAALEKAVKHVQIWYYNKTGTEKTFELREPPVEVIYSDRNSEWYRSNNNCIDEKKCFFYNTKNDVITLINDSGSQANNVFIVYVDADPACNQFGGLYENKVVVLPANDLRGLVGETNIPQCTNGPADNRGPCRWVGGLAHELGHALGLAHPHDCEEKNISCPSDAVMWVGYGNYPNTYLLDIDKQILSNNPLITTVSISGNLFDCSNLITGEQITGVCGSSNGGTFSSAPTTNLCSTGEVTLFTGTGPWSWSCAGLYGGATVPCSANLQQQPTTYALTTAVNPSGGGNISGAGISCGSDCSETFNSGTGVTLTASANPGYQFSSWTGCDTPSGNSCSVTMTSAKSVTANFTQQQPTTYTLTTAVSPSPWTIPPGGGSISGQGISCGNDCSETFNSGTSVTLTASANPGYQFSSWTGCDTPSGNSCSLTMNGNKTLSANFQLVEYVPPDTWTLRNSGTATYLEGIAYGLAPNKLVAVGRSGAILTSQDGNTWTSRISGTSKDLIGITFGDGVFVGVGNQKAIVTSSDGINWTVWPALDGNRLISVVYGSGKFVAVGSGNVVLNSQDAWAFRLSGFSGGWLNGITYGNSTFVAVGDQGEIIASPDAVTWQQRTSGTSEVFWSVAHGNGIFVAVGDYGTIRTSTDGVTWTSRDSGLLTKSLLAITFGNDTFVVVGESGAIITSQDGATWTQRTSGTSEWLKGVTYANGRFFAVGENGIILASNSTTGTIIAPIKGDINNDTRVDLNDAILAMQVISGFSSAQLVTANADVNSNGKIGLEEVIFILQKVAEMR